MFKEYGINKNRCLRAFFEKGVNIRHYPNNKITGEKTKLVKKNFENYQTGKILKQEIRNNIQFLIKIKNFRGFRHKNSYPTRGQRTHTNAKTKKKVKI